MDNPYRPIPALLDLVKTKSNQDLVSHLKQAGIDDLKPHDTAILSIANHHGGRVKMSMLSESIVMNQPTFVEKINKLVRSGYLIKEKSTEDRRAIYIITTQKSREIQSIIDEHVDGHVDRMLEGFSDEEKETFMGLLHKAAGNYHTLGHRPPPHPGPHGIK